jgi:hypothetical protein
VKRGESAVCGQVSGSVRFDRETHDRAAPEFSALNLQNGVGPDEGRVLPFCAVISFHSTV